MLLWLPHQNLGKGSTVSKNQEVRDTGQAKPTQMFFLVPSTVFDLLSRYLPGLQLYGEEKS